MHGWTWSLITKEFSVAVDGKAMHINGSVAIITAINITFNLLICVGYPPIINLTIVNISRIFMLFAVVF